MKHIEHLKYATRDLIPSEDEKLLRAHERFFAKLAKVTQDNLEAWLPIHDVDMGKTQINWYELCPGEDYESSISFTIEDPVDGGYLEMESQEELDEQIEAVETALDEGNLPEAQESEYKDLLYNLKHAEPQYAELMWNTSWRPYGDDVDENIAAKIPQVTWVRKLRAGTTFDRDGEPIEGAGAPEGTYLTLTCIGQDNGPALMAYVALAHGVVPPEYVRYWTREREWTTQVIGLNCFRACADKLGVRSQLEAALEKDAREAKKAKAAYARKEKKIAAIKGRKISEGLRESLAKLAEGTCLGDAYKALIEAIPSAKYNELKELLEVWPYREPVKDILDANDK